MTSSAAGRAEVLTQLARGLQDATTRAELHELVIQIARGSRLVNAVVVDDLGQAVRLSLLVVAARRRICLLEHPTPVPTPMRGSL